MRPLGSGSDRKYNSGCQGLEGGGMGESLLNGFILSFRLARRKNSRDWLHNNVNVLDITELYICK